MGRKVSSGGASKTVAIKLLAAKHAQDPNFRRMFDDEARLTMLLNNSNIVQVFDVGEDAGECYMAMEWVDGLNLSQLHKRVRQSGEYLPPVVSVYVVAEVLRALSYAHGLVHEGTKTEVIHRDISPQNVMLSVSGEVKLMDFGIARLSTEETSGVHIKGKLRYMPPEQLRGNARRPTVDLFAVGAILHELLEGRRFRSQVPDEARLYGMILDGEVPPLELPGGHQLPRELEEVRAGLLVADFNHRIHSAKDALKGLYRWPGYRNCSIDLEELVQRFVGTNAPRTSVAGLPAVSDASASHSHSHSHSQSAAASRSAAVSQSMGGAQATQPALDESSAVTSPTGVPQAAVQPAPANKDKRSLGLLLGVAGLAVLGISLGMVGIAYGLDKFGSDTDEGEPKTAAAEVAKPESPPVPEPASAPKPTPAAAPAEPAPSEPAPELELEPEPETPPPPSEEPAAAKPQKSAPATAKPTVSVQLLANDYFYIEAKIAGKVFKLDPIAKAKVEVGTHSVYLRESSSDSWKKAGSVTFAAGNSYKVEMLEPAGVRASKR